MRLKPWQAVLALGVASFFLGVTPMTVYRACAPLLGSCPKWMCVERPVRPLHAAMRNVTSSYDVLSQLVAEFLQQPGMDPTLELRFKDFLAERASKSYPRLESALDWLLAVYKFVFPFLVIHLVAKLQTPDTSGPAAGEATDAGNSSAGLQPAPPQAVPRRTSQQAGALALAGPGKRGACAPAGGDALADKRALPGAGSVTAGATGINGSSGFATAFGVNRRGSESPTGPETPIEGNRLLSAQPTGWRATGAGRALRPTIAELEAY